MLLKTTHIGGGRPEKLSTFIKGIFGDEKIQMAAAGYQIRHMQVIYNVSPYMGDKRNIYFEQTGDFSPINAGYPQISTSYPQKKNGGRGCWFLISNRKINKSLKSLTKTRN